jgi:three-Cys-motif partner protein
MPPSTNSFGGPWTKTKLDILKGYLEKYTLIFDKNSNARHFETYYVDAFAGSGFIDTSKKKSGSSEADMFDDLNDEESLNFIKGSAVCALEIDPPFKHYLFVEMSAARCDELEDLKKAYPKNAASIEIRQGDANTVLLDWVKGQDWKKTRAVVFLDPYGMQVSWELLKALGDTKGVDLWLLFPLGVGVMRLLTKKAPPPDEWNRNLTKIFGTSAWESEFYAADSTPEFSLGFAETTKRNTDTSGVEKYILAKLGEVFHSVHSKPRVLRNSKNNPLYLFCFACANQKGSTPAMKIAGHLLTKL